MNCPICGIELRPADRQGIEVDVCPHCRGVWLGRDELDRILARPSPFEANWSEDANEEMERFDVEWVVSDSKPTGKKRLTSQQRFWSSLFAV